MMVGKQGKIGVNNNGHLSWPMINTSWHWKTCLKDMHILAMKEDMFHKKLICT